MVPQAEDLIGRVQRPWTQSVQVVPKPPPGFRQAPALVDCTLRSVQPHWPPTPKSILACTDSQ
jgi:hypothetical protein